MRMLKALLAAALLSGCGQTGALFLPEPPPETESAPAETDGDDTTTEDDDEETPAG